MVNFLKPLLVSLLMLMPAAAHAAGPCNAQSRWWPICLDPATGPDVSSQEWKDCRQRGGCNYN